MLSGLRAGTFSGQIVLPDRSNPATGIACRTRIWHDAQGRIMAHPSCLGRPVQVTVRLGGPDFYAGLVDGATHRVRCKRGACLRALRKPR